MTQTPTTFALKDRFRCSSQVLSTRLGDESVLLHLQDGVYYGLNEVGTKVWSLLAGGSRSLSAIRDELLSEFDVSEARCSQDLLELAGELLSRNLIEREISARP